ncbi:MAG: hypothetical protein Q6368_000535 [Candidatus Baldrarchaeota archaeon]
MKYVAVFYGVLVSVIIPFTYMSFNVIFCLTGFPEALVSFVSVAIPLMLAFISFVSPLSRKLIDRSEASMFAKAYASGIVVL